jgi:hypothetical protein
VGTEAEFSLKGQEFDGHERKPFAGKTKRRHLRVYPAKAKALRKI